MDNNKFKGKISCIKLTYKDAVESLKRATGKSLIIINNNDENKYEVLFMKLIDKVVHVLLQAQESDGAQESERAKWIPIFENYGTGVYKMDKKEDLNVGNYTSMLKSEKDWKFKPLFWDSLEKTIEEISAPSKRKSLMRIFKYMKDNYGSNENIHEEIKENIDYFRWEDVTLLIKEEFYHKSDVNEEVQQIEIEIDNNLNILDKDYIKRMSDDDLLQRNINRLRDKNYIDKQQYLEQFNKYFPKPQTSGGGKRIRNKVRTRSNRMKRKGKITRKNKITRRSKKIIKSKTRKNH